MSPPTYPRQVTWRQVAPGDTVLTRPNGPAWKVAEVRLPRGPFSGSRPAHVELWAATDYKIRHTGAPKVSAPVTIVQRGRIGRVVDLFGEYSIKAEIISGED